MMVKRKKYFQNPISRQNFANAFAETPNLNLEVRPIYLFFWISFALVVKTLWVVDDKRWGAPTSGPGQPPQPTPNKPIEAILHQRYSYFCFLMLSKIQWVSYEKLSGKSRKCHKLVLSSLARSLGNTQQPNCRHFTSAAKSADHQFSLSAR